MSGMYCHKVRLGVVLVHDGKLLLVRQNNRPFWVFPGGTLEIEEGIEECAIREMQEEINLTVSIQKTLYLADFMHERNGAPHHTIDIFMLARYEAGTPMMTLDENLNDMKFFTLEEYRELVAADLVQPGVVAERVMVDWPAQFLDASGLYLGRYGVIIQSAS